VVAVNVFLYYGQLSQLTEILAAALY